MAEWKPFDLKWGRSIWYCSACEESTEVPTYLGTPMYNFCPMCGANMNMKKADGCKTESSSEIPNNSTISKMEQVDEPQTCSVNGRPYDCGKCEYFRCTADEPQTDCLEYHTDTTHFGKVKGESITINRIED